MPGVLLPIKARLKRRDLQEVVWSAPSNMRLPTARCWIKLKAVERKNSWHFAPLSPPPHSCESGECGESAEGGGKWLSRPPKPKYPPPQVIFCPPPCTCVVPIQQSPRNALIKAVFLQCLDRITQGQDLRFLPRGWLDHHAEVDVGEEESMKPACLHSCAGGARALRANPALAKKGGGHTHTWGGHFQIASEQECLEFCPKLNSVINHSA